MDNEAYFTSATNHSSDIVHDNSTIPVSTLVAITICITGVFCNSMVIVVILLGSLRSSVFMNLLMALAASEMLYLMVNINNQNGIFGKIHFGPSLLHCRISVYILFGSGIISSWITVLISVERFIAVFFPFKVHMYCTKTKTYAALLGLTIIVSITLAPIFVMCSVSITNEKIYFCDAETKDDLKTMIFIIIIDVIYSIIPFTIITTLNILIIKKVKLQLAFRAQSQGQKLTQAVSTKNNGLVFMTVAVFVVFGLTSFPNTIILIVHHLCHYFKAGNCELGTFNLLQYSFMLENINHSVNFFLYCLTGSVFRETLYKLFQCRKRKPVNCCRHNLEA